MNYRTSNKATALASTFCLLFVAALVSVSTGCGPGEEDNNNNNVVVPDDDTSGGGYDVPKFDTEENPPVDAGDATGGMETSVMDAGDGMGSDADGMVGDVPMEPCGDTTCGPEETCVNDMKCLPANQVKCDNAQDLGTLQIGKTKTINDSFKNDSDDALETNCSGSKGSPEKVYKFEAPSSSHAQIDVKTNFKGQFDAKLEFRQGKCLRSGDKIGEYGQCIDSDTSVFVPKGSTFYLVVENDVGMGGDFTIEMTPGAACSFGAYGEYGCKMGDRYLCEQVNNQPNEKKFACPAGCNNARCNGDSCSNPIVIKKSSSNNGKLLQGDLSGFRNRINFKNAPMTCSVNGVQANSLGPEVYYKIEADKGDTLSFDVSESSVSTVNDNLIYLSNNCKSSPGQFACKKTWDKEKGSWTATKKGTYWLVVDKFSTAANDFAYKVELK